MKMNQAILSQVLEFELPYKRDEHSCNKNIAYVELQA